ncbi:hypothetical protein C8R43DRAFT_41338 [Mycena crocata]|nr:hypothetical protein C8R43DRAFT_41338 [Mycena crocata]
MSVLSCSVGTLMHTSFLSVDLADDIISLFFASSSRIFVLNWREGRIVVDIDGTQLSSRPSSFSLLSPRAYILSHRNGAGAIEIWGFEAGSAKSPTHRASLRFPDLYGLAELEHVTTISGPFCARPASGKPFSKSNESRLWAIALEYSGWNYSLFVHQRHLHTYVSNAGVFVVVAWEDWGPRHTRVLPGLGYRWLRYIHGERVVLPYDFFSPASLQVLNFGRPPGQVDVPTSQFTSEWHDEPSTIFEDSPFGYAVITSLPYRHTIRPVDEKHAVFLIDEDRVIGVNDEENQMTVYTF